MIPDKKYVDIISNQPQTKGDQTYINNENIEVTTNGTYIAEAPYTGFGQVKVNVPNGTETLDVSENGTYTPSGTNIGFRSVNVNVAQSQVGRLDVTPTTSQQTLTPTGNIAGYNPVVVAAVTSAIDSNIKASNIKSGVTVLGVTGNVIESKTSSLSVTPTTSLQTFAPQSPYNGFSGVSVAAVTAAIDANITAGNIKAGTTILGVAGSVVELKGETRSVNLTSNSGNTFTPSSGKNGITSISVIPSNYPTNTSNYEITPSTTTRDVAIPTGFSGFNTLRVNAVTASIDANILSNNIKSGVTILGVTGTAKIAPEYYLARKITNNIISADGANTPKLPNTITGVGVGALAFSEIDYGNSIVDLSGITSLSNNYAFYKAKIKSTSSVNLSNLTTISGEYACEEMFAISNITSVDLSSLTTINSYSGCDDMFGLCQNLISVIGNSLTSISGSFACNYMFYRCTALTGTFNFLSQLKSISGTSACRDMFYDCTNITGVNLDNLETINNDACEYMFESTGLINMSFPKLSSIINGYTFFYAFRNCLSLTTVSFGALTSTSFGIATSQFRNMLYGCSNVTVHFPSNLQSVIGSWSDVVDGFGGTNTTVLFDLPATE